MSMKAVKWALEQTVTGSTKAVLIVISFRFNEIRGDCFPGVERIARDAGLSRATVFRALSDLEQVGLLEVEHRPGSGDGRLTNIYRLPRHFVEEATSQSATLPEAGKVSACDGQSLNLRRAKSQPETGITSNHKVNHKANHKLGTKRSRRCPEDFTFEGVLDNWMQENEIDHVFALDELEKFKDHEFKSPKKDWVAAFRNWLRRAKEFRGGRPSNVGQNYSEQLDASLPLIPADSPVLLEDEIDANNG